MHLPDLQLWSGHFRLPKAGGDSAEGAPWAQAPCVCPALAQYLWCFHWAQETFSSGDLSGGLEVRSCEPSPLYDLRALISLNKSSAWRSTEAILAWMINRLKRLLKSWTHPWKHQGSTQVLGLLVPCKGWQYNSTSYKGCRSFLCCQRRPWISCLPSCESLL